MRHRQPGVIKNLEIDRLTQLRKQAQEKKENRQEAETK